MIQKKIFVVRRLTVRFWEQIIDYDDIGNMAFGVIARAVGISDFVMH